MSVGNQSSSDHIGNISIIINNQDLHFVHNRG